MATPGFAAHLLDEEGGVRWIEALTDEDPHHLVHVVRGLEPAEALVALGAKEKLIRVWELSEDGPGEGTLLAGRVGEWTFVYDNQAATWDEDSTTALSADGRTAATSMYSINADVSLTYAVDGKVVSWVNRDDLDLEADLPGMPAELRSAFEAAGNVEQEDFEPGEADFDICMRAICALAGLYCTIDDIRRLPLLVTPIG
ncbi:hypothetical protein GKO32_15650 [Amycolatopsis sp. RM579]|uniref:Uncharacterized protein n=2 Tax=Amycolatopsis pithecellobii TaxID=664692 RepID=A0A6N7YTZ1_9PSEU|nr:hypothetical protein [Amycolatopsis pithecellobii]